MSEIRQTSGSGGYNCSFSERELCDFHNFLEKSFELQDEGRHKIGVPHMGKLNDDVWVFNEQLQINSKGQKIESQYIWPGIGGPSIETTFGKKINIKSSVKLPLEHKHALCDLVLMMKNVLKHNIIPGNPTS